jgi:hypothetical protein
MKIRRKNIITEQMVIRDIPLNPEDYYAWKADLGSIEDLMPYLSQEDADFLLAGITSDEWKNVMVLCS